MRMCKQCIVYGRVQGVFYRAWTQQKAQSLNVSGRASNLTDGSVEVLACGEEEAVDALCDWLWEGPRHAEVTGVSCETLEYQKVYGFETN